MKREDIVKSFNEIESERNKILKSIEEIDNKREEISDKIKEYDSQIVNNTNEMRMKQSRYNFLIETEKEKEGYIKSVKLLLIDCEKIKELGKGMHGVLANIISVPSEYETAIEMCLGASLQNIVTDTEEDAQKLVEHLRKNNLGRASFLPITSVKGKKVENIKGKKIGVIGIAADLVKFDKKYEQIILNLLGRTVVVDNMKNAINIAKENNYSFRIITVEGDVINPSGAITGGSVAKKTVNILGRSREIETLEKELKKLKEKIQKSEKDKEKYVNSSEDIIEEIQALEKQLQETDITYATEKQRVISIDENIEQIQKRIEKLKQEKNRTAESQKETVASKEANEKQIENMNKQNEEDQKIIDEFSNANKDSQKYIDDLNFDITNLKISVSSFNESEVSIQEITEMIQNEIETHSKNKENKKLQIENAEKENETLKTEIEDTKQAIEKIKSKVSNSGDAIGKLKKERIEKNEKLTKKEDEQTEQFKTIEELKAQITKLEVKKTKAEEDITEIINKMWEEYELTPNNAGNYQKPENVALTQRRVNVLNTFTLQTLKNWEV